MKLTKKILASMIILSLILQGLTGSQTLNVQASSSNLAIGRSATGEAQDANGGNALNWRNPATNAIDGQVNTKFQAWSSARTGSLSIDLGSMKSFNRLVINEPTKRMNRFSISVSHDGQSWTTVLANLDKSDLTTKTFEFEAVSARYIKVEIQKIKVSNNYGGFDIAEVEVYSDNLALNREMVGTGLDQEGNNQANWRKPANNARDNDLGTQFETWSSARTGSLMVDLGVATQVNKVVINEPTRRMASYKIQTSMDNIVWVDVLTGQDKRQAERVINNFETTTARYVKVDIEEVALVNGYGGFKIAEFEVYFDRRKEPLLGVINQARSLYEGTTEGLGNGQYAADDRQVLYDVITATEAVYNNLIASSQEISDGLRALEVAMERYRWTIRYESPEFEAIKDRQVSKALGGTAPTQERIQQAMTLIDDPSNVSEGVITNAYSRLITLAKAYLHPQSPYYQDVAIRDRVVTGMDHMYTNYYNETTEETGNWWNWQIGTARRSLDLTILMEEELTDLQIRNYTNAVQHFINPGYVNWNGANRVDVAYIEMLRGALTETGYQVSRGKNAMLEDFSFVDEGDGFFRDGSFLYHSGSPYTGNYGLVQANTLLKAVETLYGTPWAYGDDQMNTLYQWLYDGFEPLMYKGEFMNMANGRFLGVGHKKGHGVIGLAYGLAQSASEPHATRLKSMVKEWLMTDTCEAVEEMRLQPKYSQLLADTSIVPRGELNQHKRYPNMDRVVQRRSGYLYGLSMFSDRVKTFEAVNGNGMIAWYASSGMTYLYNNEADYYDNGYWPTINWYRLPGITVDTMPRTTTRWEGETKNRYDWVGGTDIGNIYGVSGMEIDQWNSTLSGKKSWFMFDNEIVALGSDIQSQDNRSIETVIDNRKLKASGDNSFTVNGEILSSELGWSDELDQVEWAHLEGNTGDESAIGYYFPGNATFNVLRETRTGSQALVNQGGATDPITKNYLTMVYDHGINPTTASYEYVTLPNQTTSQVASYAQNPQIEILANNERIHAVKEKNLNVVAANFWMDERASINKITSNKKASIMMWNKTNELEISVADPTMKNQGFIEVEINQSGTSIIEKDNRIIVESLSPTIRLRVNADNALGKSIKIRIQR